MNDYKKVSSAGRVHPKKLKNNVDTNNHNINNKSFVSVKDLNQRKKYINNIKLNDNYTLLNTCLQNNEFGNNLSNNAMNNYSSPKSNLGNFIKIKNRCWQTKNQVI